MAQKRRSVSVGKIYLLQRVSLRFWRGCATVCKEVGKTKNKSTPLWYVPRMQVFHPTAKMLVELSKSQDIEAGDGTTSVCVIAGALLNACTDLLAKGIHPMAVAESFLAAADKAETILEGMATPVDLANR